MHIQPRPKSADTPSFFTLAIWSPEVMRNGKTITIMVSKRGVWAKEQLACNISCDIDRICEPETEQRPVLLSRIRTHALLYLAF